MDNKTGVLVGPGRRQIVYTPSKRPSFLSRMKSRLIRLRIFLGALPHLWGESFYGFGSIPDEILSRSEVVDVEVQMMEADDDG